MATRKKQVVPRQNKPAAEPRQNKGVISKADYQNKAADIHAQKLNPIYNKNGVYILSSSDVMLSGKKEIDAGLVHTLSLKAKSEGKMMYLRGEDNTYSLVESSRPSLGMSQYQQDVLVKLATTNQLRSYKGDISFGKGNGEQTQKEYGEAARKQQAAKERNAEIQKAIKDKPSPLRTKVKGGEFVQERVRTKTGEIVAKGRKKWVTDSGKVFFDENKFNQHVLKHAEASAKRTIKGSKNREAKKQAHETLKEIHAQKVDALAKMNVALKGKGARNREFGKIRKQVRMRISKSSGYRSDMQRAFAGTYNRMMKQQIDSMSENERNRIVAHPQEGKKRIRELQAQAKRAAKERVRKIARGEFGTERLTKYERKIASSQDKTGSRIVKKGTRLSKSQYTIFRGKDRVIVYSSKKRIKARIRTQKNMERRANKRATQQAKKEARLLARHQQAVANRILHNRKTSQRRSSRITKKRQDAKMKQASKFITKIRGRSRYGKMPLKMLLGGSTSKLKKAQLGAAVKRRSGKISKTTALRNAPTAISRNILYPKMNHSGKTPLKAPVSLKPVSRKMTLTKQHPNIAMPLGMGHAKLFSTDKTISSPTFRGKGAGLFMSNNLLSMVRLDLYTDFVLGNLRTSFPAAVKAGLVSAADKVGRKMLDIVEPYVPKDTGLLYTTARTNIDQSSQGFISAAQGVAYSDFEMFGVSISYNAPYAEIVYFNMEHAHGAAYNEKHNVVEKGEKETARWIEVAFGEESVQLRALLDIYAKHVTSAMNQAGRSK